MKGYGSRRRPGWQSIVRERLACGEWIKLSDLFDLVEIEIPLHTAFRQAALYYRARPSIFDARFVLFRNLLSTLDNIETEPVKSGRGRFDYATARLRQVRRSGAHVAAENREFWRALAGRELR